MNVLCSDVFRIIVSLLDYKELCLISQVSKYFATLAADENVWKRLYGRYFTTLPPYANSSSWKENFRLRLGNFRQIFTSESNFEIVEAWVGGTRPKLCKKYNVGDPDIRLVVCR